VGTALRDEGLRTHGAKGAKLLAQSVSTYLTALDVIQITIIAIVVRCFGTKYLVEHQMPNLEIGKETKEGPAFTSKQVSVTPHRPSLIP
jgi:hypothetical protein